MNLTAMVEAVLRRALVPNQILAKVELAVRHCPTGALRLVELS